MSPAQVETDLLNVRLRDHLDGLAAILEKHVGAALGNNDRASANNILLEIKTSIIRTAERNIELAQSAEELEDLRKIRRSLKNETKRIALKSMFAVQTAWRTARFIRSLIIQKENERENEFENSIKQYDRLNESLRKMIQLMPKNFADGAPEHIQNFTRGLAKEELPSHGDNTIQLLKILEKNTSLLSLQANQKEADFYFRQSLGKLFVWGMRYMRLVLAPSAVHAIFLFAIGWLILKYTPSIIEMLWPKPISSGDIFLAITLFNNNFFAKDIIVTGGGAVIISWSIKFFFRKLAQNYFLSKQKKALHRGVVEFAIMAMQAEGWIWAMESRMKSWIDQSAAGDHATTREQGT